jgi:hypothetical protein
MSAISALTLHQVGFGQSGAYLVAEKVDLCEPFILDMIQ